jgi:hypothetical protein
MADRPTTAETNVSENVTRDTSSHSSVAQEEKQPDTNATPPPKKSLLDSLPPWVSTNLRSANSWKLVARCWVASWAAFVLLVPQASLNILGNTYVVSFILYHVLKACMFLSKFVQGFLFCDDQFVPTGESSCSNVCVCKHLSHAFHHFFYTSTDNHLQLISTVVIGILLGWGIGAAGMRGALAARNEILLKHTLEKVQSRYICYLTATTMY